jgi:hypothetical protein
VVIDVFGVCRDVECTAGDNDLGDTPVQAVTIVPAHELDPSDRTVALTLTLQGCDRAGQRGVRPGASDDYPVLVMPGELLYRRFGSESLAAGLLEIEPGESVYEFGQVPESRSAVVLEDGNGTTPRPSSFWSGLRVIDAAGGTVERSMMPLRFHRDLDLAEEAWVGVPAPGSYTVMLEVDGRVLAQGGVEAHDGNASVLPRVRLVMAE